MAIALPDFEGLLDWSRLGPWIEENGLPGSGPVSAVERLQGGSQNNLFLISRGGERFVLRRPPKHLRKNSNDTMLREARVLKALKGSRVPHPAFHAVCADESVIGACFYVMAPLDGFSPSGALPGRYATDVSWRAAMGPEFMRTIAELSKVDYRAVGLGDFGKAENWHERQVERWRSQLEGYRDLPGYEGSSLPYVDEVGRWLDDHLPKDRRIGIIHGDFQWPNTMFAYDRPKLIGAIDWELSTLGDPLLDLGWVLTSWREPGDPEGVPLRQQPSDGFGPRSELIRVYGELSGRSTFEVHWFFVLACYKLGCILEGSYARAKAGQAGMDVGLRLHEYATWLFRKAKQLVTG